VSAAVAPTAQRGSSADARGAVVVAFQAPDRRLTWRLPLTGQLLRRGEVVALGVDGCKLAGGPIRFFVDAVGRIMDFDGTWIELYGHVVHPGGMLGPRCRIEARLTCVKPEAPPPG
jgi:hypothetical protein